MKTEVHRSKALLLTSSPVSLKQQMFPSTEPITARPEETFGDEKNGTSLLYDHKTSPLSCDGEKDSSDNKKTKMFIEVFAFSFTHRVETE